VTIVVLTNYNQCLVATVSALYQVLASSSDTQLATWLLVERKFTCWVDCVRDNCDDYYNPQNRSLSSATHRATAGDHREKRSFEDALVFSQVVCSIVFL
jgi:hypothetical protein